MCVCVCVRVRVCGEREKEREREREREREYVRTYVSVFENISTLTEMCVHICDVFVCTVLRYISQNTENQTCVYVQHVCTSLR